VVADAGRSNEMDGFVKTFRKRRRGSRRTGSTAVTVAVTRRINRKTGRDYYLYGLLVRDRFGREDSVFHDLDYPCVMATLRKARSWVRMRKQLSWLFRRLTR
jgi:hypothetical protein